MANVKRVKNYVVSTLLFQGIEKEHWGEMGKIYNQ